MYRSLLAGLGCAALVSVSGPALAVAVAPPLNTAGTYTVLGTNSTPTVATVTCTNSGAGSTINGEVGSTFTSITNTACTINGAINAPVPASVVTDFDNAYSALDSLNPICDGGVIPTTSTTLAPGVYCSAAATTLGAVIFTLDGTASDVWVFKIGTGGAGALTSTGFQVVMAGTAQACNVYWRTAGAATMTGSNFQGTILSGAAFTMTGGSYIGRALATTDVTITDAAPMTFAGCSAPASVTVIKDFIPDSAATVPVALSCTSGTVTTTPLNAAEGAPAVFEVTGASAGATCTATEIVPLGYTANQTNCLGVALNGSCTITNALNSASITVNKDFIPDSAAAVPVALSCNSGTVTTTPLNAAEGAPAVFQVTGASAGATCTATETTVPSGYTANQANCVGVVLNGSCTITNTRNSASITVNKDFIPDSAATVPVALSCSSGTVTATPLNAAEGAPAVFQVTGASAGATCTATETTVPSGYTANQANCVGVALNGSCTITNTLIAPPPVATVAAIPTMSQWMYVLLGMLLVATGWMGLGRR